MNAVDKLLEHLRAQRFQAALRVWLRLGKDRLKHPALLETGAVIHRGLGKTREEISLLRRLARVLPEDAGVAVMLAETLEESGDRPAAIQVLCAHLERRVSRSAGSAPAVEARLARALAREGDAARATAIATSLTTRDLCALRDPGAWRDLGTTWTVVGESHRAIEAFETALVLDPALDADVETQLSLAVLYESARRLHDARAAAEQVLRLAPDLPAAKRVLMRLDHQQGHLDSARDHAHALLAAPMPALERSRTLLELAIVERRRGDVDAAFQHATDGNALAQEVFTAQGHDRSVWPALVDRIRAWRPSSGPVVSEQSPEPAPVFLLGFPRSGTTLMQQILQSHPAIETLDESDPAMGVLREHLQRNPRGSAYPDCLAALSDADWAGLREAYWRRATPEGTRPPVLIDKLPLNLVHTDALVRMFPNARFLVMIRDPRDSVLSNFFQDYAPNDAMVQFTDLVRSAETYAGVMDLWLDRRAQHGDAVLEVRYEALAADPDSTAQVLAEVLDFLGVDWDDAVLNHHEAASKRVITTPSRYDVARPVYAHASGRWRRFEAHLSPVLPILAPYVDAHGYEAASDVRIRRPAS